MGKSLREEISKKSRILSSNKTREPKKKLSKNLTSNKWGISGTTDRCFWTVLLPCSRNLILLNRFKSTRTSWSNFSLLLAATTIKLRSTIWRMRSMWRTCVTMLSSKKNQMSSPTSSVKCLPQYKSYQCFWHVSVTTLTILESATLTLRRAIMH